MAWFELSLLAHISENLNSVLISPLNTVNLLFPLQTAADTWMETPRGYSLVTGATKTRNLSDIPSGCLALEQPHSGHTCSLLLVEPPVLHRTLEKHLEMAGEGGLPGKWSLNQALPYAVAFLGLINISGMCLYLSSPGLIQNPRTVTCRGAFQLYHRALAEAPALLINTACFSPLRSPGFCSLSRRVPLGSGFLLEELCHLPRGSRSEGRRASETSNVARASETSNNGFRGTATLNKSVLLHLNVLKCKH